MNKLKLSISVLVSLLCCASLSAAEPDVIASVEYFYAQDGTLIGRAINGVRQNFEYDRRGQLLAVKDANGRDLERYTYDPAGNRLSKTVNGVTTTYTYDEANQLKTSTVNGETTHYRYDAAGRLVQAGDKIYYYFGANDKVTEVRQGDKVIAEFEYFMDGQIASAKYPDREENFTWDGLALVQRNEISYLNEPYVTGGNPILSSRDGVMFNDMLGSTLSVDGKSVDMTAFGDSDDAAAMFTGKPLVEELGHVFLFRNYRAELGKWQTADPLGYPDGWNQLAYCNNGVTMVIDWLGTATLYIWPTTGFNIITQPPYFSFEHWGHAAMQLEVENNTYDNTYVSWWPSEPINSITTVPGSASLSYLIDKQSEGDTEAKYRIYLNGLNEEAMAAWYKTFSTTPGQTWGTVGQNCAWTVAHALIAGMDDPRLASLKQEMQNISIWTPQLVLQYANRIKSILE